MEPLGEVTGLGYGIQSILELGLLPLIPSLVCLFLKEHFSDLDILVVFIKAESKVTNGAFLLMEKFQSHLQLLLDRQFSFPFELFGMETVFQFLPKMSKVTQFQLEEVKRILIAVDFRMF